MGEQSSAGQEVAASLAAKLDAVEFTPEERSLLRSVFEAAAGDDDVEGFGQSMNLLGVPISIQPQYSASDNQKQQMERWKIMQDTQTTSK